MLLMEFDKSGAEWVVVAYLSGDAQMLRVVESGKSPHVVTGALISGVSEELVIKEEKIVGKHTDPETVYELRKMHLPELLDARDLFLPRSMSIRQAGKKSNHGLNYAMRYRRFALENEIEESEAKVMVDYYNNKAYPGIPLWQEAERRSLKENRTITNLLGSKVQLLGEWGDDLFNQAYSYKPQSTVGEIVNTAMADMYDDTSRDFLLAELLAQVHDSIVNQYPTNNFPGMARFAIKFGLEYLSPLLSVNGRDFRIKTDLKVGLNWGHMIEVPLVNDPERMEHELRKTHSKLIEGM